MYRLCNLCAMPAHTMICVRSWKLLMSLPKTHRRMNAENTQKMATGAYASYGYALCTSHTVTSTEKLTAVMQRLEGTAVGSDLDPKTRSALRSWQGAQKAQLRHRSQRIAPRG